MNQPHEPRDPRAQQARRAAQRKKKLRRRRQQLALAGLFLLAVLLIILLVTCTRDRTPAETTAGTAFGATTTPTQETTEPKIEITWMTFPEDRKLTAQQYFVYDTAAGKFTTISHTPDTRVYPASITKLITACVAAQYLDPDALLTAGEALNLVAAGSSVAELKKGDTLTVAQLMGGMILPSGNDAAQILAMAAGRVILGDSSASAKNAVNAFVDRMNQHAQQTGLTGTHFANPDGIHRENHYTTFQDLVGMAQQALENEALMRYCATANATVDTGKQTLQWHNTNLLMDSKSEYYCPYAIGLKTGQTPYAGSCLLSAFALKDTTLIIGVFGCPDIKSRFADTLQLLNTYLLPVY